MKKTFVIVLVLFPLLVGCKDKATQELLSKGTLRAATGKVVAVGPRYITMKDQDGKVVALSNVINMERLGALPEACLRDQKNPQSRRCCGLLPESGAPVAAHTLTGYQTGSVVHDKVYLTNRA